MRSLKSLSPILLSVLAGLILWSLYIPYSQCNSTGITYLIPWLIPSASLLVALLFIGGWVILISRRKKVSRRSFWVIFVLQTVATIILPILVFGLVLSHGLSCG